MAHSSQAARLDALRTAAIPLASMMENYDALLDQVQDASLVLLGEATHGSHEFYRARIEISQRLIAEHGFSAVAIEADWPDAYRINRYVRGLSDDDNALDALGDFQRFPRWMWRNTEVLRFVEWLKEHNTSLPETQRAGFYGLDLYSLYSSIEAVIHYLQTVDPAAAEAAHIRYGCLDHGSGREAQHYGYGIAAGLRESCREEAVAQLVELRKNAARYLEKDGLAPADEQFSAEQNARLVQNAEQYYRAMFERHDHTWNLRDRHMVETLTALREHLAATGRTPRIVVWAHNSHIGDARATEMAARGEHNVGQLARQRFGRSAALIGFTTHHGTVSAASHWDGEVERKQVRAGLEGSFEALFHATGLGDFYLPPGAE